MDAFLTADRVVASSIPALSHTFVESEIFSTAVLPPSAYSRRVVVSYKQSTLERLSNAVVYNTMFDRTLV